MTHPEPKLDLYVNDGDDHAIQVSTTYNDKIYSCVVSNFMTCQKPKIFLYEIEAIQLIKGCDCKSNYPVDKSIIIYEKEITVKIYINRLYIVPHYIELVLKEDPHSIS
jgi:hypothetical protein